MTRVWSGDITIAATVSSALGFQSRSAPAAVKATSRPRAAPLLAAVNPPPAYTAVFVAVTARTVPLTPPLKAVTSDPSEVLNATSRGWDAPSTVVKLPPT